MAASGANPAVSVKKVDYVDAEGIQRRVIIPEGATEYQEGIPISLPVDNLYQHCSAEFRQELMAELRARGLIEACDYLKPGASELIRASLIAVVKKDVLDIISFASEECVS